LLVVSAIINAEFGREDYGSIPDNYVGKRVGTI
jgi:hypothetical protein